MGFEEDVLVDVIGVATEAGDRFVLCSDGLSNLVENHEIRDTLERVEVDQAPQALIDIANARGGDDNITAVAVHRLE